MSDEPTVAVMPPHAEFCDWSLSDGPCNCGLDHFAATMVAQARREAWDEGYSQGVADERMSQETTAGEIPPGRVNPHRAALRGDA